MELTKATLELLRDEAYVLLCREAILDHLEARNREKQAHSQGHPPPPLPVPKRSLPAESIFPESDPDVALYSRLSRIGRLERWIQRCLRVALSVYLEESSPTFKYCIRIQQALNEWEFCVRHVLPDSLAEFARELRGLRMAATEPQRRGPDAFAREFFSLRRIASRVEEQQLQVARIASAIAGHAQQLGATDVQAPILPNFRRIVWVDWLSVVPLTHLVAEVTRIEGEIRGFLNRGHAATLQRLQAARNACGARQEGLLQAYWGQLREHAQSHYVEERELDAVLDSLSFRYEAELERSDQEIARARTSVET